MSSVQPTQNNTWPDLNTPYINCNEVEHFSHLYFVMSTKAFGSQNPIVGSTRHNSLIIGCNQQTKPPSHGSPFYSPLLIPCLNFFYLPLSNSSFVTLDELPRNLRNRVVRLLYTPRMYETPPSSPLPCP